MRAFFVCIAFFIVPALLLFAWRLLRAWRVVRDQAQRLAFRCDRCGYSRQGLASPVCPECGGPLRPLDPRDDVAPRRKVRNEAEARRADPRD